MNEFAKLLGEPVSAVFVEKDTQVAIRFQLGYVFNGVFSGPILNIGTYADCCSETWFADIIGIKNLLGQQVIAVEILDVPKEMETPDRTRQEDDAYYGIRIKTKLGDCDIIYRNSSNGYYGGSEYKMTLEEGDELEWEPITDDWQAGEAKGN